jgi:DNA-binding Xre family transcriptional regulator
MSKIITQGKITALLGRRQMSTGERWSLRRLAHAAQVPKDFVYRLDSGQVLYVELGALVRLCEVLQCNLEDILVWKNDDNGDESI